MNESRSLGVSELARALGMSKATVQNILFTLESEGFVEQDKMSLKYKLGPRLFQLGMSYANSLDLTAIARGWLERLCTQYGETARLGILMGERIIVVMEVKPETNFMTFPGPGSAIPPHTSSIGKILFAFMPQKRRDRILKNIHLAPLTPNSIIDIDRFLDELDAVRKNGVAFDREESILGLSCVAAPVFNHSGECVAAISLSGNSSRIDLMEKEITNAIKYIALRISQQMGYRGGGFSL